MDTTDVQGYQRKFENQRELLQNADINDDDRRAIRQFIAHERANKDVNTGTLVSHLNRLRLAAERAHLPLTEMGKPDVDVFMTEVLEDDHGLSDGTRRNYRKALRVFFDWRGEDWYDEIVIGASIDRKHDPDAELGQEELDAILDAAANPRDRAMVALLADTGLRIGAVLSLQMQHVNFDGDRATVTINDQAHVKDDDGRKPVTWSRGIIANYLDVHPRPGVDHAALIHKTKNYEGEDGALAQQYAGRRISMMAERAGLDPDRVQAHLFRATAISNWIREGLNEQAIKHRTGWSKDSRMFQTYSRVTDEEMNDAVFDHYGIDVESEDVRPTLEQCPSCRTPLRGGETFCPGCADPLASHAEEVFEQDSQSLVDRIIEETDGDARAALGAMLEAVGDDVSLAERRVSSQGDS